MKRDKKQEELLSMRHFIAIQPDFPKGKLYPHESPDFVYKLNRRKNINIELTELFLTEGEPSGNVSQIIKQLKQVINKKNEKIRLYNAQKPYQNWLVIYCDHLDLPKGLKLEEKLSWEQPDSKFDKTYLVDLFTDQVIQLFKN
jgi:hypothetical protein